MSEIYEDLYTTEQNEIILDKIIDFDRSGKVKGENYNFDYLSSHMNQRAPKTSKTEQYP